MDNPRPDPSPASAPVREPGPAGSLASIKAGYGVVYAIDGAILPFLSVFFAREHGLSPSQIGSIVAAAGAMAVLTPFLVSVLADSRIRAGRLLMLLLGMSGVLLATFPIMDGYWSVLALYAAFSLVREPTRPLLDGIFFAAARTVPGVAAASYHRVRFWGTFGYMIPGVVLYIVISNNGGSLELVPITAAAFALLAIVIARFLPDAPTGTPAQSTRPASESSSQPSSSQPPSSPPPPPRSPSGSDAQPVARASTPARPDVRQTVRAASRLIRRPKVAAFFGAMFLLEACAAAYHAFYPLLAIDVAGLPTQWLGIVTNVGVAVELIYVAGFGWLVGKLGWRRFMVVGAGITALRVALLAAFPTVAVVVATQAVHGMAILVQMVAARVILDKQTTDEIRHTTQGLYTMLVIGGGRIVGSAIGGLVAAQTFAAVFACAAVAAAIATMILFWALSDLE